MQATSLYETDFYAWAKTQAAALQQENFEQLDIANLIEEIEDMGKSQQRQLESRLIVLLAHLLKWQHQPGKQSRSWQATIDVQRIQLHKLLKQNPSLRPSLATIITEAYEQARKLAWAETGLDLKAFSPTCPYTAVQILDDAFLPA